MTIPPGLHQHNFTCKKAGTKRTTAIPLGVGGGILTTAGLGLSLRNFESIFDPDNPPKNETLESFLWITGGWSTHNQHTFLYFSV